jgi:hypothetical protein
MNAQENGRHFERFDGFPAAASAARNSVSALAVWPSWA